MLGAVGCAGDRPGARGRKRQNKDLYPAQSSYHVLAPTLLPQASVPLLTLSLSPCCQQGQGFVKQIKSSIDLPQLLVPQVTVKTEWVEFQVCLASLLLIVVFFLRERVLLVPGRCR